VINVGNDPSPKNVQMEEIVYDGNLSLNFETQTATGVMKVGSSCNVTWTAGSAVDQLMDCIGKQDWRPWLGIVKLDTSGNPTFSSQSLSIELAHKDCWYRGSKDRKPGFTWEREHVPSEPGTYGFVLVPCALNAWECTSKECLLGGGTVAFQVIADTESSWMKSVDPASSEGEQNVDSTNSGKHDGSMAKDNTQDEDYLLAMEILGEFKLSLNFQTSTYTGMMKVGTSCNVSWTSGNALEQLMNAVEEPNWMPWIGIVKLDTSGTPTFTTDSTVGSKMIDSVHKDCWYRTSKKRSKGLVWAKEHIPTEPGMYAFVLVPCGTHEKWECTTAECLLGKVMFEVVV
jgi:hypothetical protein